MSMTLPPLTGEGLRNAVLEMCEWAVEMLRLTRAAFLQSSQAPLDRVGALGHDIHLREKRLTDHVAMQLREAPWVLGAAESLAFLPAALERIGDSAEALARCVRSAQREGIPFSDRAVTEVSTLFTEGTELLKVMVSAIRAGDRPGLERVRESADAFHGLCDAATEHHQERLLSGDCVPRASSIFLAMVDSFREIGRYVRRMAAAVEKSLPARQPSA
jgi:phosphate:Na+ symporter